MTLSLLDAGLILYYPNQSTQDETMNATKKIISPTSTPLVSIDSSILQIRGQKVMIDTDLAALYGVPTKALNQAIKRNSQRFPQDFMFQLSPAEKQEVVTNCDHLAKRNWHTV